MVLWRFFIMKNIYKGYLQWIDFHPEDTWVCRIPSWNPSFSTSTYNIILKCYSLENRKGGNLKHRMLYWSLMSAFETVTFSNFDVDTFENCPEKKSAIPRKVNI